MNDQNVQLRSISWRAICPWLLIVRSFSIAIVPTILMFALLGAMLSTAGWRLSGIVFLPVPDEEENRGEENAPEENAPVDNAPAEEPEDGDPAEGEPAEGEPAREESNEGESSKKKENALSAEERESRLALRAIYGAWPGSKKAPSQAGYLLSDSIPWVGKTFGPLAAIPDRLASPFAHLCSTRTSWNEFSFYLFGGIWSIAVWAFLGGAICRAATLRLGLQQYIGFTEATKHARRHYLGYFSSPLLPAVPIILLVIIPALLGLALRLDFFAPFAGLLWFLVLGFGFVITLVMFAVLLGWPLMFPAVASECSDAFDAFSRSFSYVYQRPLHYLFYVAVAGFIGMLGWMFLSIFSESVINFTYWSVAWGSGVERVDAIREIAARSDSVDKPWLEVGISMFTFWENTVRAIAAAFTYSYFWVAATAIYLLLRKDVDNTDLDQIFVQDVVEANLPNLEEAAEKSAAEKDNNEEPEA